MITFKQALSLTRDEVYDISYRHLNPLRLENMNLPYFVRADNQYLWDEEGSKYLDMATSIGVQGIGNCNDSAREALITILEEKVPGIQAAALHPFAAAFAKNLSELSPGSLNHVWFGNCGTEAVEAAIKIVNLAKRNDPSKKRIVSCLNAFHGRTVGSLSLMGEKSWNIYNQKKIENHTYIPFNDLNALEKELKKGDVIAFFVEPIQGEAGVIVPDDDYLPGVRALCDKYDALLVCDEIQTGFGRTGKLWAFENWGIVPDACTFAKGFSAGYVPIGGVLVTDELWDAAYGSENTFFLHTNTYMEGSMACGSALISLEQLVSNDWIKNNAIKGSKIIDSLNSLKDKYPHLIKAVRGKGLLIAIEYCANEDKVPASVPDEYKGGYFTGKIDTLLLKKYHVIGRKAGTKPRMRFLPPFCITDNDIEYFIQSLDKVLAEISNEIND